MSFAGDAHAPIAPSRVVSQAEFDSIVQENVVEFGMSRAEAAADALQQFSTQHVDLRGVLTDGSDPSAHPVVAALAAVRPFAAAAEEGDPSGAPEGGGCEWAGEALQAALGGVAAALAGEGGARARAIGRSHGGVTVLSEVLLRAAMAGPPAGAAMRAAMHALRAQCVGYDDARREVQPGVARAVCGVLATATRVENEGGPVAGAGAPGGAPPVALQRAALALGACLATKREDMKIALFHGAALGPTVARYLRASLSTPEGSERAEDARTLAREACALLVRVLTDDDLTVQASKAFEFATLAAGKEGDGTGRGRAPRGSAAPPPSSRTSAASTGVPRQPSEGGGGGVGSETLSEAGGANGGGGGGGGGGGDDDSALLSLLLAAAERYHGHVPTLCELYSALKALIVNDEICREVDALGGIDSITRHLGEQAGGEPIPAALLEGEVARAAGGGGEGGGAARRGARTLPAVPEEGAEEGGGGGGGSGGTNGGSCGDDETEDTPAPPAAAAEPAAVQSAAARVRLMRTGLRLLRTLANSDPNKVKMGTGATLRLLLQSFDTFAEAPSVLEQAAAAVSNLCLRIPDNAVRAAVGGALPLLARAMRKHAASAGVQRSGCLALRNLVVKSPERVQTAFDEGAAPF